MLFPVCARIGSVTGVVNMIIYNAGNIDHNKRFILSIIVGVIASVLLGIAYGVVQSIVRIEMEIVYIFIGWCIGRLLIYTGHGVTLKYSILGAILAFVSIIVGDIVSTFGLGSLFAVLVSPSMWMLMVRMLIISKLGSLWGILGVLFRVAGIYTAYQTSRIF